MEIFAPPDPTNVDSLLRPDADEVLGWSQEEQIGYLTQILSQIGPFTPNTITSQQDRLYGKFAQISYAVTKNQLKKTYDYQDIAVGIRINSEVATGLFDQLSAVVDHAVATCDDEYWSNQVSSHINRAVVENFSTMTEYGNQSRGDRGNVYPGLEQAVDSHVRFLVKYAPEQSMFSVVRAAHETGYGQLLEQETFEDLNETENWRAAVAALLSFRVGEAVEKKRKLTDEEKAPLKKLVEHYGFNSEEQDDLISQWIILRGSSTEADDKVAVRYGNIARQIEALEQLTEISPTIAKKTYELYGIRNFDRYPPWSLQHQLEPNFTPDLIAVSATADWNGALITFGYDVVLESLAYQPLFVEASSAREMARIFYGLRNREIAVKKILVGAHGSEDSILLGVRGSEDIQKEAIKRSIALQGLVDKRLISANTEVILFSCDTGTAGGIAETIAELPGVEQVIAPSFKPSSFYIAADSGIGFKEKGEARESTIHRKR